MRMTPLTGFVPFKINGKQRGAITGIDHFYDFYMVTKEHRKTINNAQTLTMNGRDSNYPQMDPQMV